MTRRRTRRALAFAGLALCLLMLVALLLNQWWDYYGVTDAVGTTIYISRGSLGVTWVEGQSWFATGTSTVAYSNRSPNWSLFPSTTNALWSNWKIWPALEKNGKFHTGTIPLWILFVLIAVPSAIALWRTRRLAVAGHCTRCGYNLTGNTTGRCPECGANTACRNLN